MKHFIMLKDNVNNQGLYAHRQTILYYLNCNNESQEKDLKNPFISTKGGSINIHYYRVNGNGEPIDLNGIVVENPTLAQPISETEIFVYDGSTVLPYNILGYEISAHNIGGYIYNNYYIDEKIGTREKVCVSVTKSKPKRDIYFGYILNEIDCSLNITQSKENIENQKCIFKITVTNSNGKFLEYFYEIIKNNISNKIDNILKETANYDNSSNKAISIKKSENIIIEFNKNVTLRQCFIDDKYILSRIS